MLVFLKKTLLFLSIPVIFLTLLAAGALRIDIHSKELMRLDDMMLLQRNTDCLLSTGIQETIPAYKFRLANRANLDVLAAGSSRMAFFRREFFKEGVSFVNASHAIQNLPCYINFLSALDNAPEILLFDINQWYFDEHGVWTQYKILDYKNGYRYDPGNIIRLTMSMLLKGDLHPFMEIGFPENIGLIAVTENSGFNKDGALIQDQSAKVDFDKLLGWIENNKDIFTWKDDDTLYEPSINEVERILQLCRSRGIKAIGILPPFAPAVWQAMMKSGHYHYMLDIFSALKPLFDRYGAELYDFNADFDNAYNTTYDGFHPDERAVVNMLRLMKEQGSAVGDCLKT